MKKQIVATMTCLSALAIAGGMSQPAQAKSSHAKAAHAKAAHHQKQISVAKAEKIAVKKYPGAIVGKTVLENEDGQWQYSVNVRSGKVLREIMVDAHSGKIADVEVTTDAKEAAEAKAEAKEKDKGKPEADEKENKK